MSNAKISTVKALLRGKEWRKERSPHTLTSHKYNERELSNCLLKKNLHSLLIFCYGCTTSHHKIATCHAYLDGRVSTESSMRQNRSRDQGITKLSSCVSLNIEFLPFHPLKPHHAKLSSSRLPRRPQRNFLIITISLQKEKYTAPVLFFSLK